VNEGEPQGLTVIVSRGSGAPEAPSYPVPMGMTGPLSSGSLIGRTGPPGWRMGERQTASSLKSHMFRKLKNRRQIPDVGHE